jgi:nicotinamide-nucleotide amidase
LEFSGFSFYLSGVPLVNSVPNHMIEILSIGNEILSGGVINTNTAFIAQSLRKKGFQVLRQTTLGDDPALLKKGIQEAVKRSSLILTTGGLGPTFDDTTKQVLSELFEKPLVLNEEVAVDLKKRFPDFSSFETQAFLPKGAHLLPNTIGTAPGFVLSSAMCTLIAMPGVPQEMMRMLEHSVIPYLEQHFPVREKTYEEDLYFTLLSETKLDPVLREMLEKTKGLEIGIYPSLSQVRVHLSVTENDEKRAKDLLFSCREKLVSLFPHHVYPSVSGSIAESVQELFLEKKKKLSIAESCTGGALSRLLTKIPHSSEYFLGSVVCYTDEVKRDLLKVREKTLKEKGAVSRQAVCEMIDGLFHVTKADYALAISGIAGPGGGTEDLPVGSVYIGVGKRGEKSDVGLIHAPKDRLSVIEYSAHFALSLLWRRIAFNLYYFDAPSTTPP